MYLRGCVCEKQSEGLAGVGFNMPSLDDASSFLDDLGGAEGLNSGGGGGDEAWGAVELGANFVPGVGQIGSTVISVVHSAITAIEKFFHVGAGRKEADVITPIQNQVGQYLDSITNQIRVGRNPTVSQLQGLYAELQYLGAQFKQFVGDARFKDGRASVGALNTIMPLIDGTCGYSWPPPMRPGRSNCLTWGDGTVGGPGQDGQVGAISRAILRLGGRLPAPSLVQGVGMPSLGYGGFDPSLGLPQSGTLNYPAPPNILQAGIIPIGQGSAVLPIVAIGLLGFMFLRR